MYGTRDGTQRPDRGRRIGQVTVGENRDWAVFETPDGRIEVAEVIITNRKMYDTKLEVSKEGFEEFANLISDIVDALNNVPGAPSLPIDGSKYMKRIYNRGQHHDG